MKSLQQFALIILLSCLSIAVSCGQKMEQSMGTTTTTTTTKAALLKSNQSKDYKTIARDREEVFNKEMVEAENRLKILTPESKAYKELAAEIENGKNQFRKENPQNTILRKKAAQKKSKKAKFIQVKLEIAELEKETSIEVLKSKITEFEKDKLQSEKALKILKSKIAEIRSNDTKSHELKELEEKYNSYQEQYAGLKELIQQCNKKLERQ